MEFKQEQCSCIFVRSAAIDVYMRRKYFVYVEILISNIFFIFLLLRRRLPMHAAFGPLDEAYIIMMRKRSWFGPTRKIICESSPCRWAVTWDRYDPGLLIFCL